MALTPIVQDDWGAGAVRDVARHLIPPQGAWDVVNGILDDDGSIYRRGGSRYLTPATAGFVGVSLWDGFLRPGQRTLACLADKFVAVTANDAGHVSVGGLGRTLPGRFTQLEGILFVDGGGMYAGSRMGADVSAGTVTVTNGSAVVTGSGTTWAASVDAGMLFRISGERAYVVKSVESDTQLTLDAAYEGATGGGKAYQLSRTLDPAPSPYVSAEMYAACADRLWTSDGGRTVKFSDIGAPHSFQPSNVHEFREGVQVLGMMPLGLTLAVFTTAGVWRIMGAQNDLLDAAGNPTQAKELVAEDVVLWGRAGIAAWRGSLIVPALSGVYVMDGMFNPQSVSKPIEALYREYVEAGYVPGQACVYRDCYFLPIINRAGGWEDLLVARLDKPIDFRGVTSFPWTRLAGRGGQLGCVTVRVRTDGAPMLLAGERPRQSGQAGIVDCTGFFKPDASNRTDADGSTHNLEVTTRDYVPAGMLLTRVRRARLHYELTEEAAEGPSILCEIDAGPSTQVGGRWDQANWDALVWAAGLEGAWEQLSGMAPPSTAAPYGWHVNRRRRQLRLRLRSQGAPSLCRVKALELTVAPPRQRRN